MTEEQIKTNAEIYTTEYYFETPEQFYVAGAKSRDKEIADLKEHIAILEESAKIKADEIKYNVGVIEKRNEHIELLSKRCNQLLKDKGDLTDELSEWKSEWQEQVQKANEEGFERTKLTIRVNELEAKIEKMKCCIVSCCEGCERLPKLYKEFENGNKEM